jgi:hypothetical protein
MKDFWDFPSMLSSRLSCVRNIGALGMKTVLLLTFLVGV